MKKDFGKINNLVISAERNGNFFAMVVENVVLTNFRKQKSPPVFTNVACRFLNIQKCKCKVYDERKIKKVIV